jgi:uncharacterized protein (TIGR03118 family)
VRKVIQNLVSFACTPVDKSRINVKFNRMSEATTVKTVKMLVLISTAICATGCNSVKTQMGSTGYRQANLVSDAGSAASRTDPGLINPWGIAFIPGQTFWIANNKAGSSEVLDVTGALQSPSRIVIPSPSSDIPSAPTGIVFNPIADDFFVRGTPAQLLFATEDGTVSTWAEIDGTFPETATLAINNSVAGTVYKGLAILTPACCREYLALADFRDGFIVPYDISFNRLATLGTFTDPDLPRGYVPFNIQQIGDQVFVTFALQDAAKHDPVAGAGNGIVDIFAQEGVFIRRFVSNGPLNAPWGIVQSAAGFGPFSNDILIGNFGDGTINAFNPSNGNFLGSLKDSTGNVIRNAGLWGLIFRADGVGDPNAHYFTAGGDNEKHGVFGTISFVQ